jgi:NAD(P)-dependent dehydrogenase (short-subunit alcohol dehydrogenase family)
MASKFGIVTAAGSGMGRAGAVRFAREGAAVAVADIDAARVAALVAEIEQAGGRVIGLPGDLRDDAFCRDIVARAVAAFGRLDFVWNHLGHPGPSAIEGIDMEDFDLAVDLNLRSVLVTTAAAIPHMLARGTGSLLYTASTSGIQGSPFSPVYSACKFGVIGFARSLAKRYGRQGIRANVVCPGSIDTPMLRVFVARPDQESTAGKDPEDLVQRRVTASAFGRAGQPEEVANAALFLLSDEASFVSGAVLSVDGAATA